MMNGLTMDRQEHPFSVSDGFTILEVVVAMFVFSVGILAVLNMQIVSIEANHKAKMMSEAAAIASSTVSELRAVDYNSAALNGDTETGSAYNMDDIGIYSRSYRVRRIASLDSDAAVITITVSWLNKNKTQSLVYDYYKMDEGN